VFDKAGKIVANLGGCIFVLAADKRSRLILRICQKWKNGNKEKDRIAYFEKRAKIQTCHIQIVGACGVSRPICRKTGRLVPRSKRDRILFERNF
jgi:hypothetical protein